MKLFMTILCLFSYSLYTMELPDINVEIDTEKSFDSRTEMIYFRSTIGYAVMNQKKLSPEKSDEFDVYNLIVQRSYDGIQAVKDKNLPAVVQAKESITFCFEQILASKKDI